MKRIHPDGFFDVPTTEKLDRILDSIEAGGDPSPAEVAAAFPAMRYHSTIVGVKGHPLRVHVGWDGLVSCPGGLQVRMLAAEPLREWREMESKLSRSLLDGHLPVVSTTLTDGGLRYEQTVLGYSRDLSPRSPLAALIRIRVVNDSPSGRSGTVGLRFERGLTAQEYRAAASPALEGALAAEGKLLRDREGRVVAWFDAGGSARVTYEGNLLAFAFSLPARGEISVEVRLARLPIPRGSEEELAEPRFDDAVARTRRAWDGFLAKGMALSVPEPELESAWKAWAIYGALLCGEVDSRLEPHDAADFYEHFYGHAAACYLHTLAFRGHFEEAKRIALTFIALQRPNGMLSGELEVAHQNGSMLLELCRLYLMSGDADWFGGIVPALRRSCRWIVRERAAGSAAAPGASRPLTRGLLPEHQYCVDEVARFTRAQDYLADALNWAGLDACARAFRVFGLEEEASRLELEAEAYREDILGSMSRAAFPAADPPFLPLVPGREEPYASLTVAREGSYYCLLAPRMLESGIFDVHDERSAWVRRYLEERGGLVLGVSAFTRKLGIDAHFVLGYALENLRNGRVGRFLLTFRTFMLYGMSRDTFSPPECYLIQHGWGGYLREAVREWPAMPQPHLHSLAQMLRLARAMLIQEDGEALHLARGVPREWLEDGKTVSVEKAQTTFGPVSFRLRSELSAGRILAEVELEPRNGPASVRLHLRRPGGAAIRSVEVDGASSTAYLGETVSLKAAKGRTRIVIRY